VHWQYPDARDYYARMLADPANINIFLNSGGKRVGYVLAVPHDQAVTELLDDDPKLQNDPAKYYIETIGILPESRQKGGLRIMLARLVLECQSRSAAKLSMHARSGFSAIVQKNFRILVLRPVAKWRYTNFEESVDYIEIALNDQ
jgi:ribosomal protein S18 acetylase RimI-like enzyme